MKLADLLQRVWQRGQTLNEFEAPRAASHGDSTRITGFVDSTSRATFVDSTSLAEFVDRTSMAEFVRILQDEDRKPERPDPAAN